ncbi:MAG TPA: DUF2795 domain-containing protein [Alphaproteobacteria bacterium]
MITTPVTNTNPISPKPAPLSSPAWEALKGVQFPVDMRGLIVYARERGADNNTLAAIAGLPDRTYTTPREVASALGIDDNVTGSANIWSPAGSEELAGERKPRKSA